MLNFTEMHTFQLYIPISQPFNRYSYRYLDCLICPVVGIKTKNKTKTKNNAFLKSDILLKVVDLLHFVKLSPLILSLYLILS
jgi:hypothetical protein